MRAGQVDDDAAGGGSTARGLLVREAEEDDVGAAREGRIVRDEAGNPAPPVAAEPRVEGVRRLAGEGVRAERVELEARMCEHPVERLLTRVAGRAHDSRCRHRRIMHIVAYHAIEVARVPLGACRNGCYAARAVERVLVLNASYEPLNVCSLRRAHVLVWKGKAEILESHGRPLRSSTTNFERPHVIRL